MGTQVERRRWNGPPGRGPTDLYAAFLAQAGIRPRATAVGGPDGRAAFSYAALRGRAELWSAALDGAARGPGRGAGAAGLHVGVAMEASAERVAVLLAIARSGAAWVPLPPEHPVDRLRWVAKDAGVSLIVADPGGRGEELLSAKASQTLVPTPAPGSRSARRLPFRPLTERGDSTVCTLYTSGSTGRPKGVRLQHRALMNLLRTWQREPGFGPGSVAVAVSSLAFDMSLIETFLPLVCGGTTVPLPREVPQDPTALAAAIRSAGADFLLATPTTLRGLVEAGFRAEAPLRVVSGGEALPAALARELLARGCSLWNGYGVTEATACTLLFRVRARDCRDPVALGRATMGQRVYLLDERAEPVSDGAAGEIWIAGAGVSPGYCGAATIENTSRFQADPWAPPGESGARMYRSGDRGRRRADGAVEYLGRLDAQLKVRGVRIEPGELEALLHEHPSVAEAAMGLRSDAAGREQLVAWVKRREGKGHGAAGGASPAQLRDWMAARLPASHLPQAWVFVDRMPRSTSGKLDRAALPSPRPERPSGLPAMEEPAGADEAALCGEIAAVLGLASVSPSDPFVLLGGDSLRAAELLARIEARFGRRLPLAAVLDPKAGDARGLLAALGTAAAPGVRDGVLESPEISVGYGRDCFAASSAQRRLWFEQEIDPASPDLICSVALDVLGSVRRSELERALSRVVERNEALRTRLIPGAGGELLQRVLPPARARVEVVASAAELDALAAQPLDLRDGPTWRAGLLRTGRAAQRLLLAVHHAFFDGRSAALLLRDLAAALAELRGGARAPEGPRLRLSDHAAAEAAWAGSAEGRGALEAAASELRDVAPQLPLPSPLAVEPAPNAPIHLEVPRELGAAVALLARGRGSTPFSVMLAAWAAVLAQSLGRDEIVVATLLLNRDAPGADRLMGCLASTHALRLRPGGGRPFPDLVDECRDATASALARPALALDALVRTLSPPRIPRRPAFCDAAFLLQEPLPVLAPAPGLQLRPVDSAERGSPFPLMLEILPAGGDAAVPGGQGWQARLRFRPDVVDGAWAAALLPRWLDFLRASVTQSPSILHGGPLRIPHGAPRSLPALLRDAVQRRPGAPIVFDDGDGESERIDVAGLLTEGEARASALLAAGLRPGQPAIVLAQGARDFLPLLWGSFLSGLVPVPLALPPIWEPEHGGVARVLGNWRALASPPVIADRESALQLRELARRLGLDGFHVLGADALAAPGPERPAAAADLPDPSPDSLAILLQTSGSTGVPKPVQQSGSSITAFLHAYCGRHGLGPGDVFVNWLGLDHVAPLFMCHLAALHCCAAQVHLPPAAFAARPLRALDALHRHRGSSTFAANFAFRSIADAAAAAGAPSANARGPAAWWDLSCCRVLANGGESIVPRSARRFLEALAPHGLPGSALVPIWGMSETCSATITSAAFRLETTADSDTYTHLGGPVDGFSLRIADESGSVLPRGRVGRLQVRGDCVTPGYLGRPEANAESFTADGWFDTGDLGFVDGSGLTLTGRAKDVIIVRGANHAPHEIEDAVDDVPGVLRSYSAACGVRLPGAEGDGLAVFLVPAGGTTEADLPALLRRVRGAVVRRCGVSPACLLPVERDAIPKTGIGKIQRSRLRQAFERGDFAALQAKVEQWLSSPSPSPRSPPPSSPPPATAPSRPIPVLARVWEEAFLAPASNPSDAARSDARVVEEAGAPALLELLRDPGPARRILVVGPGAQRVRDGDRVDGAAAASLGLLLAARHELPGIRLQHVDPGEAAADREALARIVAAELLAADPPAESAWRGARRYVPALRPAGTPPPPGRLASPGLVILLGGLGGLGRLLARELLAEAGNSLLILGRRQRGDLDSDAATVLGELERAGSCIYASADSAAPDAAEAAVAAAIQVLPALPRPSAIYLLAARMPNRTLRREDGLDLERMVRERLGGWELARRLASRDPGMLVVDVSSVNGLLGGWAAGAYSAACRAGAAGAAALRDSGSARVLELCFSRWEGVGLSAGLPTAGLLARRGLHSLPPAQAIGILRELVAAERAAAGSGGAAGGPFVVGLEPGADGMRLDGETIAPPAPPPASATPPGAPAPVAADRTREPDAAPAGALRAVLDAWRDVLGQPEVGADQNFFEAGGHSLLLAQLQDRLESALGRAVPLVELFRHSTPRAQAAAFAPPRPETPTPPASPNPATPSSGPSADDSVSTRPDKRIAIIGMSFRFPGSADAASFWDDLVSGRERVRFFSRAELLAAGRPASRIDAPDFVPARALLDDADCFDAELFGIPPAEALRLDPQQRIFLECCWAALEDAGHDPRRFAAPVGVFGGCSANTWLLERARRGDADGDDDVLGSLLASDKDHLATRVAFRLDLRGPAMTVQTACSTSLVALHLACQSLLRGECDLALAGAASLTFPQIDGHRARPGDILSPDGHTRAFDARAAGTLSGDGAAIVVLRRLEDARRDGDCVRAIVLGSGIGNDGADKVGYTAPSLRGQADAVASALRAADVDPASVGYVEAHGTATPLGDPVEVLALDEAWRRLSAERGVPVPAAGSTAIGSVKTNLGHLNTAAGMAGLVKTVLALERGVVPPSLGFQQPNPVIPFASTPFFVAATPQPWPGPAGAPRRAGVSSFGAGGTNAHVVLEAPPSLPRDVTSDNHQCYGIVSEQCLCLSAASPAALDRASDRLARHLAEHPDLPLSDVAFTLRAGRRSLPFRRTCLADDASSAAAALLSRDPTRVHDGGPAPDAARPLVLLFPGQGFQRAGLGAGLYAASETFRAAFDDCARIAAPLLGGDLRDLLRAEDGPPSTRARGLLDDQLWAGPLLFALGWSLARCWLDAGVQPAAVLGQSTGEYVAAAVAGVLDPADALRLLLTRARLMAGLPRGAVLHVPLPAAELRSRLPIDGAWLALINAPSACVVTGAPDPVAALEDSLRREDVPCRRVRVSVPAHSPLLLPIAGELRSAAESLPLRRPAIPLWSGVAGRPLRDDEATDPEHWVRHLLQPVLLADCFAGLGAIRDVSFLECGPHGSVGALATLNLPAAAVVASLPPAEDPAATEPEAAARFRRGVLSRLWCEGVGMRESSIHMGSRDSRAPRRVPLPSYAFERQRFGLQDLGVARSSSAQPPPRSAVSASAQRAVLRARPARLPPAVGARDERERLVLDCCEELLGIAPIGRDDEFVALGADSLLALRLLDAVSRRCGQPLPASALFRGFTPAALARHVPPLALPDAVCTSPPPSPAAPEEPASCLIPLRRGGSRTPLFFVHPAAGVVFPFFELARQLGENQPFFGLQAAGVDGSEEPDTTVAEMAARYAAAIRAEQPCGPWRVGGFSFGCYVAYEVARVLSPDGREVLPLLLVDEPAPLDGERPGWDDVAALWLGSGGLSFFRHFGDWLALGSGNGGPRPSLVQRARGLAGTAALAGLLSPDARTLAAQQPAMRHLVEILGLHLKETFRYAPPPWPGRAVLFQSDWTRRRRGRRRPGADRSLGWSRLLLRGVEVLAVPGDHLALLRRPCVEELARQMTRVLGEA